MSENGAAAGLSVQESRALVLERLREDTRFVLATHENMDGDALGSLLAMQGLLAALGKDSLMESYLWTIHRFHREHEPPGRG